MKKSPIWTHNYYLLMLVQNVNRFSRLTSLIHDAIKHGHSGLFTIPALALLMETQNDDAFRGFLGKACKNGTLQRITKGIYASVLSPPASSDALVRLIPLLRPDNLNYISLESQLSHIGEISQIPMDRVTVMTSGAKGCFETPYGILEFTHTKRDPRTLLASLYLDAETGILRANKGRAIADLKRVGRNLTMLEEQDVKTSG